MGFLFDYETTMLDRPVFAELGLKTFAGSMYDGWGKHKCGTVKLKWEDGEVYAKVKVSVTCAPAQFWRFEIRRRSESGKYMEPTIVETGSGTFKEYLSTVKQIAQGMVVIKDA